MASMISRIRSKQKPQQSHFDKILATMSTKQQTVSPIILETLMAIAVSRILVAIFPTLRTLSISIASDFIYFEGSPALPVLEELTIVYGNGGFGIMPVKLLASFHPLTSLGRLSLQRFYHWSDAPEMLSHISRLAPEVKLVMLPWIRTEWGGCSLYNTRLSFLAQAATIYIQLPTLSPSLSPWLHDRIIISDCQRLAEDDDRVIFKRSDQESWKFNGRELEREWEARINGDDGCWTTDDIIDLPIWTCGYSLVIPRNGELILLGQIATMSTHPK
jgi:hypothetical protein